MRWWFKFYPKILENPIIMKDADHLAIWTYLLMKASHKEFDIVFNGERKTIKAGQIVTGRKQIAAELSLNENKVYRVLKTFENEQQIEQVTDHKKSIISIKNWELYQASEQVNEQQVNNCRTSSEQVVNTKIRIIDKENNKNNNIPPISPTGEWEYKKHSCFDNIVHFLQCNEDYAEFYRNNKDAWDILEMWLKYKTERGGNGGYKTETGVKTFLKKFKDTFESSDKQDMKNVIESNIASSYQGITWDKIKKNPQSDDGFRMLI